MVTSKQLSLLKRGGVDAWNLWREKHPSIIPILTQAVLNDIELSGANLSGANLSGANLSGANLNRALLTDANLVGTNLHQAILSNAFLRHVRLSKANLSRADLNKADLRNADLSEANLSEANLSEANLNDTDLRYANLSGTTLTGASLVRTNLAEARLDNALVYGISVWDVQLEGAQQGNLIITSSNQPTITVDNLEIAQFFHLLLNKRKIRDVIDTISSKIVLILGRFTPERKSVVNAISDELRKRNYLPILFDFDRPRSRDFTETLNILAHLSRFIIADLTDASSIPLELGSIVPRLSIPIQPLIIEPKHESAYAMMLEDLKRYPWVLPTYVYRDLPDILSALNEHIIEPSEQKASELELR